MKDLQKEFNKLFTRKSLDEYDKGRYMEDWYVKDGIVSKMLWCWITENYISKEEVYKYMKEILEEMWEIKKRDVAYVIFKAGALEFKLRLEDKILKLK